MTGRPETLGLGGSRDGGRGGGATGWVDLIRVCTSVSSSSFSSSSADVAEDACQ